MTLTQISMTHSYGYNFDLWASIFFLGIYVKFDLGTFPTRTRSIN